MFYTCSIVLVVNSSAGECQFTHTDWNKPWLLAQADSAASKQTFIGVCIE